MVPLPAHSDPHSEADTKARLLEAAGEVFARCGFHQATIREICELAGANVAAVNYHFGDKETLYRAVLEEFARVAFEKYPIAAGVTEHSSAEERLFAFIRNYLNRLLAEGRPAWHGKLLAREMVEPTGALEQLAEQFVRPQYARLRSIVTDLLGPAAKEPLIRHCCASVVGQCLFYKHCRNVIERIMPEQGYCDASLEELATHISEFTARSLSSFRRQAEGGGR